MERGILWCRTEVYYSSFTGFTSLLATRFPWKSKKRSILSALMPSRGSLLFREKIRIRQIQTPGLWSREILTSCSPIIYQAQPASSFTTGQIESPRHPAFCSINPQNRFLSWTVGGATIMAALEWTHTNTSTAPTFGACSRMDILEHQTMVTWIEYSVLWDRTYIWSKDALIIHKVQGRPILQLWKDRSALHR